MSNQSYLRIYRHWAPVYDLFFTALFAAPRRRVIERLALQPGEWLLIPGVGTGQDLLYIPNGVRIVAGDYSPAMLSQAVARDGRPDLMFQIMDAQRLAFPSASFDAVLLNLILAVVPDGKQAMQEAWRVLKPGGRAGIFDKFLPEGQTLSPLRTLAGRVTRQIGTDLNRRLGNLTAGLPALEVVAQEPSLFNGLYQLYWLHKGTSTPPSPPAAKN
jgi:ubiquinone/menaquinone biosynthesis C-methylase UbiE